MRVRVSNLAFSKNNFLVDHLLKEFPDALINSEGKRMQNTDLVNFFSDAQAVIVGLEQITADILDQLPSLRIIAKYGVGLDNIDIKACEERGVKIGWTGGVNKRSVAEMALGFMLALSRNLFVTSNELKNGVWNKSGGVQLTGKKVGIIGLGNIGCELVRLLKPFNCEILVNDIANVDDFVKEYELCTVSKETLFSESDIISIHTPLTEQTRNLINLEVLKTMRRHAILINTARGGIVNETNLKEALTEGFIAGAALDVYEPEPPVDTELLSLPNLICTPHTGGNAYEAVVAMGMSAIEHLINYRENKSTH